MQLKNIVSVSSHNTNTVITFQFQRLLEEAAVEKERLVTELQYVIINPRRACARGLR